MGFYYCDTPLQFTNLQNFKDILAAINGTETISFRNWDAYNLTSLENLFADNPCKYIGIDMESTQNITNLSNTFASMDHIHCIYGIKEWDTANVTTMSGIFQYDYTGYFSGEDLSNLELDSLVNLNYAFEGSDIPIPEHLDTSNVMYMNSTFKEYKGSQAELHWDTSNVTTMESMFEDCDTYIDVSYLDTSSVTTMENMFRGAVVYGDVSSWDVSHVTNMSQMFAYPTEFYNDLHTSSWNTSSVTDMSYMFATSSQSPDDLSHVHGLENWDVSSVTNFEFMFSYGYAGEHREVPSGIFSNWNINSINSVSGMFEGCNLHNYSSTDFDGWINYTGYFSCDSMFKNAILPSTYSQEYDGYMFDISSWNIGESTNLSCMFEGVSFGSVDAHSVLILPDSYGMSVSHAEGCYTDFFQRSDIDKLVWNNMIIRLGDHTSLSEIFGFTGSDIMDDSPKFQTIIARNWYIDDVSLSNMFSNLHYLINVDLSDWNVHDVTDFSEMFYKPNDVEDYSGHDRPMPGVLDFSSLDHWIRINYSSDFTRMCASNLDDVGNETYHAFEQGYRFPNWSGGTWDTTGLQVVHIDQANYPYYYDQAGEEYDAYCFGTNGTRTDYIGGQRVTTPILVNKPPRTSTFGTFIPTPSTNWTYDWDLTQSLTDTAQNQSLVFLEDGHSGAETTTPPVGQYTSGTGIIFDSDGNDYFIKLPANLLQAGTILEMDFTHFETGWADFGGNFIVSTNEYFNEIGFSFDREGMEWIFMSSHVSGDGYDSMGVTSDHEFANSTMRLECIESANSYTQWKIYKDGTLIYTNPETSSGSPFLPQQSSISGYEWGFSPYLLTDVIVTGIRILIPS